MFGKPLGAGSKEEVRLAKSMFWQVAHLLCSFGMDVPVSQMQVKTKELDQLF
jgi:hypothetical protein